ncbi:MAG: anaerobic ribonucleoside triphosphate reductase [Thermofilaceae archaeon]
MSNHLDLLLEKYGGWNDFKVLENANKYPGPTGYFSMIAELTLEERIGDVMPKELYSSHESGRTYIHKLPFSLYIPYCTGHSIRAVLSKGLKTPTVVSRPAKHFDTLVDHITNFLITMQHYFTGAQALSSVEWYAGPFIRADKLDFKHVKQHVQRLVYNLNYPTRIGLQCLSQDTRILTPDGWKSYAELREGDPIYTFNMRTKKIEVKPVKQVAIYSYKGKMYNLRSRVQDQLVSPGHRVVWLSFDDRDRVRFTPIEEVARYRSPIPVPTPAYAENSGEDYPVPDDVLKLLAWFLACGGVDRVRYKDREYRRVVFYRSDAKNPERFAEVLDLLDKCGLRYTVSNHKHTKRIRLDIESTKRFFELIGVEERKPPQWVFKLSRRQARLFIETFAGCNKVRKRDRRTPALVTRDPDIKDALVAVAVLAGFSATVRKKSKPSSKREKYLVQLGEVRYTSIRKIEEDEDYDGIIWSVNTDNETVIAERNGTVFITGNTPFTNFTITMDAPKRSLNTVRAIYGGADAEPLGTYEDEAKLFVKALAELYLEGDSIGQPFTFPIPTLMATAKWIWEDPEIHELVFKLASRRGSFYWLNTNMVDPDGSFAMCCRIVLDREELNHAYNNGKNRRSFRLDFRDLREEYWRAVEKQRFGGVWSVPDSTGSVNVVDVNLPRLALESQREESRFWELYDEALRLAKATCEWFRSRYVYIMRNYPNFYSMIVEYMPEFPEFHFNTIGLIGLPEAAAILMQEPKLWTDGARSSWLRAAELMRKMVEYATRRTREWMIEEGVPWNVEEVPGESAAPKLALKDMKLYPELVEYLPDPENPVYSTSIAPYYAPMELYERVEVEQRVQKYFTGGVMMHIFLDEEPDPDSLASLTKKLLQTELVYWSYTPAITLCHRCGKEFVGLHTSCPRCGNDSVEIWSRIVGYYRPLKNWNPYRKKEFWTRKHYRSLL